MNGNKLYNIHVHAHVHSVILVEGIDRLTTTTRTLMIGCCVSKIALVSREGGRGRGRVRGEGEGERLFTPLYQDHLLSNHQVGLRCHGQ